MPSKQRLYEKPTLKSCASSKVQGQIDGLMSKLYKTHMDVMENETRIWLLKSLLKQNLSTNDVYAFAVTQAGLRTTKKSLDKSTMVSAMRAKVSDIKATVSDQYRTKVVVERELLRALDGRSYALRKRLKRISGDVKKQRIKLRNKFERKISHLKQKQRALTVEQRNNCKPTVPPNRLARYSSLTIFGTPETLPKKRKAMGPFICKKNIILTKNELKILSKDPKYNLLIEPTEIQVKTEVERSLCKHRFNESSKNQEARLSEVLDAAGVLNGPSGVTIENKQQREETERLDEIYNIFKKNEGRYVFNPITRKINFNSRRASDYKLNKNISLPKSLKGEAEFECEMRRREFMECFHNYRSLGRNGKGERKISNITKEEFEGLNSLKKRMENKEILITQTDKSGRFALLSHQQYLESGLKHTCKDQQIGWREVAYLQGQVNSHMWWCNKILGYGKDKEEKKMLKNTQGTSLEIPNMVLLIKDHKKWSECSGEAVPSRPVMSGNSGINTHLSEVLSELLEPIVREIPCAEVSSTEEAMFEMEQINNHIKSGGNISTLNALKKYDLSLPINHNSAALNAATFESSKHDELNISEMNVLGGHDHCESSNMFYNSVNVSAGIEEDCDDVVDLLCSLRRKEKLGQDLGHPGDQYVSPNGFGDLVNDIVTSNEDSDHLVPKG